jgi:protein phosphatase
VDDLLPIGEFSKQSGLSPKRLRSYAAAGLLVPAAVDGTTGYRYYAPGQLRDARLIDALRRAGVPLASIAGLLRDPSVEDLDVWASRVATEAAERHEALEVVRSLLEGQDKGIGRLRRGGAHVASLVAVARSEIGCDRDDNEDAALCRPHLVAVADGMGGLPGGEVASNLTISLLDAAYTGASVEELEAIVRAANAAIGERARAAAELTGMGTTVCAAGLTSAGELAVVNVGDSRAYLLRDGALQLLTDDHTITAELVRQGQLAASEAPGHPLRNVLTRVLGAGLPTVDVDRSVHRVVPGDRLLLCTDGLVKTVADAEIVSVVGSVADLAGAAGALVDLAGSRHADDDVTVVVADVRT